MGSLNLKGKADLTIFVGTFQLYLTGQLGEKGERERQRGEDMQELITGRNQTLDAWTLRLLHPLSQPGHTGKAEFKLMCVQSLERRPV